MPTMYPLDSQSATYLADAANTQGGNYTTEQFESDFANLTQAQLTKLQLLATYVKSQQV